MNTIEYFHRAVERFGERPFLFDADSSISYRTADQRSDAIAEDLRERGIGCGDTVSLGSPDRMECWLAILGCRKIGARPATTGDAKGVVLSDAITPGSGCFAERLQLSSTDVLLATTPFASGRQLVAVLLPAMQAGASVGLAAGSSTETIWDLAVEHRVTVLLGLPLTLSDFVNSPRSQHGLGSLRLALSRASWLAPRVSRDFFERFGAHARGWDGTSRHGGVHRAVEGAFYDHDAVQHAVVVESNGTIEGFVELRSGFDASDVELHEFVIDRVDTALRPRRTTIVESMPRLFGGKADRWALTGRIG